jgi:hypothetical protein
MIMDPVHWRDGIVEEEYWRAFERPWDLLLEEVLGGGTLNSSEHEGNVIEQSFGEDGRQNGARVVHIEREILGEVVDEDEDSTNRVDVLLNKSYNTLCAGLVSLNIVGAGQPRRVEDTNLTKRLFLLILLQTLALTNIPLTLVIS